MVASIFRAASLADQEALSEHRVARTASLCPIEVVVVCSLREVGAALFSASALVESTVRRRGTSIKIRGDTADRNGRK
jgi:hypothetical protein